MRIDLTDIERNELITALNEYEDAEAISTNEYIVDFYDDTPSTVDCVIDDKGVEIVACAELLFDEEMDGWYMGERIFEVDTVKKLLLSLIK